MKFVKEKFLLIVKHVKRIYYHQIVKSPYRYHTVTVQKNDFSNIFVRGSAARIRGADFCADLDFGPRGSASAVPPLVRKTKVFW